MDSQESKSPKDVSEVVSPNTPYLDVYDGFISAGIMRVRRYERAFFEVDGKRIITWIPQQS